MHSYNFEELKLATKLSSGQLERLIRILDIDRTKLVGKNKYLYHLSNNHPLQLSIELANKHKLLNLKPLLDKANLLKLFKIKCNDIQLRKPILYLTNINVYPIQSKKRIKNWYYLSEITDRLNNLTNNQQ